MRAEFRNVHRTKEIARAGDPMALVEARHRAMPAFVVLVDAFLVGIGAASEDVAVEPDRIHGFRLVDREFAREWRNFYRSRAHVDVVVVDEEAAHEPS